MFKDITIEKALILVLWLGAFITYSIALANDYLLYLSDKIGLVGLVIVTIINWKRQKHGLLSLSILLFMGMLNVASFVYFINIIFAFGYFNYPISPGIQLYSFLIFFILILVRRPIFLGWFKKALGTSDEKSEDDFRASVERFKAKFKHLSDAEISLKLNQGLVEEARLALIEIRDERSK